MTTKKTKAKVLDKPSAMDQSQMLNSASLMSAVTSDAFSKGMFSEIDLPELIKELEINLQKVQSGDMVAMEAMLVGQASALQTIFVSLARRASNQEYLKQYGMYMTLALKAQSQSRATIQALTELKYPKQVAFVKQANISHGHQQVNNDINTSTANARAKENSNQPNELLEVKNGCTKMDTATAQIAGRKDNAMATLEK